MDDIKTKKDIAHLVITFYEEVKNDNLIGAIFNQNIDPESWPYHLEKMIGFWTTILLHEKHYQGNPFSHHIKLDIHERHFDRWIKLFNCTVNKNFKGKNADEAMLKAEKMRLMFEAKLKHIRANPNQYPIL